MTRDDIIRMAEKAGAEYEVLPVFGAPERYGFSLDELERFAALVAADEREACAKVCEALATTPRERFAFGDCAAAIRARES